MPIHQHTEWFKNWFDSNYYHILYKHRDWKEAESFIDNLVDLLKPAPKAKILDMPCGKGRHSIYLNKKGFDVTGIDLSPQSAMCAKKNENQHLFFFVHDMREHFKIKYFDIVLNLFTSLGYFEDEYDNQKVITAAAESLKPGGIFVIDFFNAAKVAKALVKEETKITDEVEFKISRKIENKFVVKKISITDGDKNYAFYEKVQLLVLSDFEKYLDAAELKIQHLFGDYSLNPFNENTSERLIIVSEKNIPKI